MSVHLRIAGIGINALGAVILAWRVKGIVDTLVAAQHANETNFRVIIDIFNGRRQAVPLVVGMNEHVERRQKRGIWLLVIGFVLIALGNVLIGVSLYLAQG